MLYDRTKQIKFLDIKLGDFQKEFNMAKSQMIDNENSLHEKDHKIAKIQLELVQAANEQDLRMYELKNGTEDSVFDQARERETYAFKQTVSSLQRQLKVKDELVSKYRDMLKTIRHDHARLKGAESSTIIEKNVLINTLTLRQISRFEKEPVPLEGAKERDYGAELDIIDNLEKNITAKDVAIWQLQTNYEEIKAEFITLQTDLSVAKSELNVALEANETMREDNVRSINMIVTLEEDLEKAQSQLSRTPPKDLSDLVSRLESEVSKRESKLKGFGTVILEVLVVLKKVES